VNDGQLEGEGLSGSAELAYAIRWAHLPAVSVRWKGGAEAVRAGETGGWQVGVRVAP
jgi:hypothetical protein